MTEDLVFYTNPMSRGRIVRWMLEELGEPYRTELIDYTAIKADAFRAINPMGKVPALRHKDAVVTETGAICAYLADAFPAAGLAPPPGDLRRAAYFRWMFFAAGPVDAAVTNKALGIEIPPERQRMMGYGCLDDVLTALENAISHHDFVAGDVFSAADVYFGSQIGWGLQFGTIEKRPSFQDYWARISMRPAAVRAREIDDALLRNDDTTPHVLDRSAMLAR